ncbi:MAG TPA: T9SS type A sorting domain-containing protein [Bacteroidia bacterium]|nr:T9SS type A sorting domain-containing protein [Bacteroidia bacterium]
MKRFLLSAVTALTLGSSFAQSTFFDKTCYRGAFAPSPSPMWTNTWAEWDPQNKTYGAATATVSSDINTNTTWSTGQVILLTAPIYVTGNSILTIQPGVTILGKKTTGAALIITQGSKIFANGTAAQPIVFTSDQAVGLRGLGDWGGIIVLGKASNNNSGGTNNIEGLPISNNTLYGGGSSPDDNDNSGSLQYVRIEYCGVQYAPNQEINGLTFGAVGRGTTVDYIQVSYCNDDAFEWFGGSVNAKHLISYRNLDDDFDTDNGFSGKIQYGLAVRDPQFADNPSVSTSEFFESDNDAAGTAAVPQTSAIFSNMTCIGPLRGVLTATYASGNRSRARIRRNSALRIYNSILIDQATRGMFIDGSASETNALNNNLKFKNNIVAGYGQRATESGTFGIITPNVFIIANANDTLKLSSGILTTPYNYTSPDYRPSVGSIALSNASFTDAIIASATNPSVVSVTATFASSLCIGNGTTITAPASFAPVTTIPAEYCSLMWTVSPGMAISSPTVSNPTFTISTIGTFTASLMVTTANGVSTVTNAVTTYTCDNVGIREANNQVGVISIYPNPTSSDITNLKIDANNASTLNVLIYDLTGKVIAQPVLNHKLIAGENNIVINTSELNNGIYFVTLKTNFGKETVKLVVNR